MKFTVIPVTKMKTRTYDIYVLEDVQKVEKTDDFEGYAIEIIDDIRWRF